MLYLLLPVVVANNDKYMKMMPVNVGSVFVPSRSILMGTQSEADDVNGHW